MWLRQWSLASAVAVTMLLTANCTVSPEAQRVRQIELGKKYLQKKDYNRALLAFRNAAQAVPSNPEAYYQLSLAYSGLGDWPQVVSFLRKATELDPNHGAAQLRLAELMTISGQREVVEDAQQRLLTLLGRTPGNADALTALAAAELHLDKRREAEQHLEEALRASPGNLSSAVALARLRIEQKDWLGAEQVLKNTAGRPSADANAFAALGEFYLLRDRWAEAADQFRRALQIDSTNAISWQGLASAEIRAGRPAQAAAAYRKLSELPDKQYRAVYGDFLMKTGQTEAALAEFQRIAKQDPADRNIRTGLVLALAESGKPKEAEKVLAAALERNPKDVNALLQRSGLQLAKGHLDEAQSDLNQVVRMQPDSAEAHYMLAAVHEGRKDSFSQRQELTEALRLDPRLVQARIVLASLLMERNSPQLAMGVLNEAPEDQKNSPALVAQQNWARLALGQKAEVERSLAGRTGTGADPAFLLQDALLKLDRKQFAEGRAALLEVLGRNPEDQRALELLVRSYAAQGQPAAGLAELRTYVARHAASAPLQQYLGVTLQAQGQKDEARRAFMAAKAANPKLVDTDLSLAQIDLADGKIDAARQSLQTVLDAHPDNITAQLWLGHVAQLQAAPAVAIDHYRRVLERDPNHQTALNNLAYLLADSAHQPDEALKYAEKAKELAPESPAVEDTLGWVLYQKGLYGMAVRRLETAVSQQATAQRRYHLGMAYLKNGEEKRGRESLAAALRQNPQLAEAKQVQAILAQNTQPVQP